MADVSVTSELNAAVWKIEAGVGAQVAAGDVIMILESMKMEIPIEAPAAGVVSAILVKEGDIVNEGQKVAEIKT
jgi:biotin carboxyl carrier protein